MMQSPFAVISSSFATMGIVALVVIACERPERPRAVPSVAADAGDGGGSIADAGVTVDEAPIVDLDVAVDVDVDAPITTDATDGPIRVPYRALAITSGNAHTCVLLDDHNVKCWGENSMAQLGLGDMRTRGQLPSDMGDSLPTVDLGTGRTAKGIVAARYSTCAVLDNDSLKCWGYQGLLGLGAVGSRGGQPGEMGDDLPVVDFGAGRSVKRVGLSTYSACALLDDDTVGCWSDAAPSLGTFSDPKVIDIGEAGGLALLFADGTVRTGAGIYGPGLTIDLGEPARLIAGFEMGGCAALRAEGVMCWNRGSRPLHRSFSSPTALSVGSGFRCLLLDAGTVRCAGFDGLVGWQDDSAELSLDGGKVRLGQPAVALSKAGWVHTCAILADGSVKCWGGTAQDAYRLGGGGPTADGWPAVDLGTRLVAGP